MHHLSKLTGTIEQRPPIFSAIKKDGQPLYKRARRGETDIEVESRMVTVDGFDMIDWLEHDENPEADFEILCGGGTYVRSLARDLGSKINGPDGSIEGIGACMSRLERSACGWFEIDKSYTLDEISRQLELNSSVPLIRTDAPLRATYASVSLSRREATHFVSGRKTVVNNDAFDPDVGDMRCVYADSPSYREFLGIG
eukprot:g725.t1